MAAPLEYEITRFYRYGEHEMSNAKDSRLE